METKIKEGQDNLKCILTDAEMLAYGKEVSRSLADINQAADELEAFKASQKNKTAKLTATVNDLSGKIRQGYEFRYVPTKTVTDFKEGTVKIFRQDTGECYAQRALNSDERQLMMDAKETQVK